MVDTIAENGTGWYGAPRAATNSEPFPDTGSVGSNPTFGTISIPFRRAAWLPRVILAGLR